MKKPLLLYFLSLTVATTVYAAGTSSSSWGESKQKNKPAVSLFDQGVEAHNNGDYQRSLAFFERALKEDRNNPDIFNMLAHAQLKLGMIDEALENYRKALALLPRFAEAREYLGEAYIQAALREIETLKGYGSEGTEELEDLTNEFKKAAGAL